MQREDSMTRSSQWAAFKYIWLKTCRNVIQTPTSRPPLFMLWTLSFMYLFPKKYFKMKLSVETGAGGITSSNLWVSVQTQWNRSCRQLWSRLCSLQSGLHLFKVCFSQQDSTSLFCSIESLTLMPVSAFLNGGRGSSVDHNTQTLKHGAGNPAGADS